MADESLRAKAYRHLHDEIVSGRIAGGTVLSEAAVAKTLGISRTPVGEAVRELVREGLLQQVPRYGTVVRQLDRSELVEHYELREALESYAAAQAARRAGPQDVARVNELCETTHRIAEEMRNDDAIEHEALRRFLAADMAFHLSIVHAAGNRRIADVIYTARSIGRIFSLRRQRHDRSVVEGAYQYHRLIADAIARGDAAAASRHMLEHIESSKRQALERFDADASRGTVEMELPIEIRRELSEIEEKLIRPEPKQG